MMHIPKQGLDGGIKERVIEWWEYHQGPVITMKFEALPCHFQFIILVET